MRKERLETRLRSLKVGMSKKAVEQLIGKPDDIWKPDDHPGTWTVGTSEVWAYGTRSHNSYATKGNVYFDIDGKVQFVYGSLGRIDPKE